MAYRNQPNGDKSPAPIPSTNKTNRVNFHTVSPYRLAAAFDIPVDKIFHLAEMGYLCLVDVKDGPTCVPDERIVEFPLPEIEIPVRVVDRVSILLWLCGLDEGTSYPVFNKYMEMELIRIARLPELQRTEQGLRFLLRYRDAEAVMKAVARIRAEDMAAMLIQGKSQQHKRKLEKLMGIPRGLLDK